ncbi:MAG: dipeptide epimerase [Flavobacteriales bacterium]|nr:dipeptide epimerase [Flavobacteriales bacterium]
MQIHLDWVTHQLKFRFPFQIAHGVRTHTDVVFLRLRFDGLIGYGEAALPPYLPDNIESTIAFFEKVKHDGLELPDSIPAFMAQLNKKHEGNMPAKAALDVALWNLSARLREKSSFEKISSFHLPGVVDRGRIIPHTYTIGICSRDEMKLKINHALENGFQFFKLKMNGTDDEQMLSDFKSFSDLPFAIDANQGWNDVEDAIAFSKQLETAGCVLIEQPFHKNDRVKSRRLKDEMNIPVIADEACQRLSDIDSLAESFSGINIKLQKCGGLSEAMEMISKAKSLGLKILIGCMSESSVGCNAGEALAPLCDWADLDGPWLIEDNPDMQMLFSGLE